MTYDMTTDSSLLVSRERVVLNLGRKKWKEQSKLTFRPFVSRPTAPSGH